MKQVPATRSGELVRTAGLEPATFSSGNYCSIQLSYARKLCLGYANETQSATLVFGLLDILFFLVLRGKNSNAAKKRTGSATFLGDGNTDRLEATLAAITVDGGGQCLHGFAGKSNSFIRHNAVIQAQDRTNSTEKFPQLGNSQIQTDAYKTHKRDPEHYIPKTTGEQSCISFTITQPQCGES